MPFSFPHFFFFQNLALFDLLWLFLALSDGPGYDFIPRETTRGLARSETLSLSHIKASIVKTEICGSFFPLISCLERRYRKGSSRSSRGITATSTYPLHKRGIVCTILALRLMIGQGVEGRATLQLLRICTILALLFSPLPRASAWAAQAHTAVKGEGLCLEACLSASVGVSGF